MGFRLPSLIRKPSLNRSPASSDVPKGYLAVYVGNGSNMKRFVIPVSLLSQPSFQELLSQSKEGFGFDHPMGGLTIPCREDAFAHLVSSLNYASS